MLSLSRLCIQLQLSSLMEFEARKASSTEHKESGGLIQRIRNIRKELGWVETIDVLISPVTLTLSIIEFINRDTTESCRIEYPGYMSDIKVNSCGVYEYDTVHTRSELHEAIYISALVLSVLGVLFNLYEMGPALPKNIQYKINVETIWASHSQVWIQMAIYYAHHAILAFIMMIIAAFAFLLSSVKVFIILQCKVGCRPKYCCLGLLGWILPAVLAIILFLFEDGEPICSELKYDEYIKCSAVKEQIVCNCTEST